VEQRQQAQQRVVRAEVQVRVLAVDLLFSHHQSKGGNRGEFDQLAIQKQLHH
jgi:hypothetical protein